MFTAKDVGKKHLERKQPAARKRFGLLEKKKDYQKRAQDYHKKQAHLALLRSKAEAHNEDEFDYGMIRSRTKDGVKIKERETSQVLGHDAIKLMKTQDEGYIRTLENQERKNVLRARNEVLFESQGRKTVFVESEKDLNHFDDLKSKNEQSRKIGTKASVNTAEEELKTLKELKRRAQRQRELSVLRQEVDLQRELMKKGPKIKQVSTDGKVSYRWLNVRKR